MLSLVEVGLGVASIVLGAVGISWVRGEHKPRQGDASPVWSGLCVGPGTNSSPHFLPPDGPRRISGEMCKTISAGEMIRSVLLNNILLQLH